MLRFIDQEEPAPIKPGPAAPTFDTSKLEQDMGQVAGPWTGKPGQFANKGSLQNGLDALNKAGASPIGFANGSANDIELVRRFYEKNPNVANQYDLPVNLFLRYVSGAGDKGLAISQEQGSRILAAIGEGRKRMADPKQQAEWLRAKSGSEQASHATKLKQGWVPIDYPDLKNDKGNELKFSLGRFWAQPEKDGGYRIVEDFNFPYAGKGTKGGLKVDPGQVANDLVIQGVGSPFRYTLIVGPDGKTRSVPKALSQLQISPRKRK